LTDLENKANLEDMYHINRFKSVYRLDFFFLGFGLVIFNLMWIINLVLWWQSKDYDLQVWLFVAGLLWMCSLVIVVNSGYKYMSHKLILDETGVTYRTGLIFVRKSRVPYFKINNIVIENFLWFDNLRLETGNDNTDIYCKHIENGEHAKRQIELLMLKANDQTVINN
jgi:membrane protein YdbS with pleckstrin-like domain